MQIFVEWAILGRLNWGKWIILAQEVNILAAILPLNWSNVQSVPDFANNRCFSGFQSDESKKNCCFQKYSSFRLRNQFFGYEVNFRLWRNFWQISQMF